MKKIFILAAVGAFAFASCDHVENPFPPGVSSGELNWDLYPDGDSSNYVLNNQWPTWSANTNTNRNVLIEDFTGHLCIFCPNAATEAENIEAANPGRVFVSTIHTSPNGLGSFQQLDVANSYVHDFTCAEGLAIGQHFGDNWAGSPFQGNPYGTVSRSNGSNGYPVQGPQTWNSSTTSLLSANDLKVNLQAAVNYYSSTRGVFLHVEAEVLDQALTNELKLVVQLHEDTITQPQKMPDNSTNYTYVHHDVMRGTLDGRAFGQTLDVAHLDANGKYYFDYSYELPAQYVAENMNLVIYVRDAVTEEIYHVIEKHVH